MIPLIFDPVALCVLVWFVAGDNAEIDRVTMFLIAFPVGIAATAIMLTSGLGFLAFVAWLLLVLALAVLLMRYCCLTDRQAVLVAVLYYGWLVGFALIVGDISK
jgi:hypothetical protein